eukprot:1358967-Rhodomonas_salina.3
MSLLNPTTSPLATPLPWTPTHAGQSPRHTCSSLSSTHRTAHMHRAQDWAWRVRIWVLHSTQIPKRAEQVRTTGQSVYGLLAQNSEQRARGQPASRTGSFHLEVLVDLSPDQ